jgi:hypothetical protein
MRRCVQPTASLRVLHPSRRSRGPQRKAFPLSFSRADRVAVRERRRSGRAAVRRAGHARRLGHRSRTGARGQVPGPGGAAAVRRGAGGPAAEVPLPADGRLRRARVRFAGARRGAVHHWRGQARGDHRAGRRQRRRIRAVRPGSAGPSAPAGGRTAAAVGQRAATAVVQHHERHRHRAGRGARRHDRCGLGAVRRRDHVRGVGGAAGGDPGAASAAQPDSARRSAPIWPAGGASSPPAPGCAW